MGEGLPAWARLAKGWPVECGPAWLNAEHGRITPSQYITIVDNDGGSIAAAAWLLLSGDEERRGYAAYDLLLGTELEASLRFVADHRHAWERAVARARERLGPNSLSPCASVTIPGATEPAVIWEPNMSKPDRAAALAHLVDAVREAASTLSARSVVFTNIPAAPTWDPLRAELTRAGYRPTAQSPATTLDIPPGGLEAFLTALPGPQRKKSSREIRTFSEAIDTVTVNGGDRLLHDDIVDLLWQRFCKYAHPTPRSSVVDRMIRAQNLPDLSVLVAERRGRACAFKAFVEDYGLGRIVSRFSGCKENDFFAYFNIVFYEPIRYGAAHGFATMTLGTESYRAKIIRGGVLEPLEAYVRVADPRLRGAVDLARRVRTGIERRRMMDELPTAPRTR
jgi:predicted N-acyltransferase